MSRPCLIRASGLLAGLGLLAGCGGAGTVRCGGVVQLDGKPVPNASVMFIPKDAGRRPATGKTDASGRFQLTTFTPGDGVLPGAHTVTVMACEVIPPAPRQGPGGEEGYGEPTLRWLVPEKYSRPDESGLTADVRSGQREFTFNLSSQ